MEQPITVTCYGETKVYESRRKATDFFLQAMLGCDPRSSEYSRYASIIEQLMVGYIHYTDESED